MHLTFVTGFLLALESGRVQIRSMLVSTKHGKDCMYPSPGLHSNQLAKKGAECVIQVVIDPALATILDKSLKADRSLQSESLVLLWTGTQTSDRREKLFFVSFKKGFDKIYLLPLSHHGSSRL